MKVRKPHRRIINEEYMSFLWWLSNVTIPGGHPIHTRSFLPTQTKASTDGAYLTKWGLIKRHSPGWYTIEEKGLEYLEGKIMVPAWALVLDNEVLEWGPLRYVEGVR